MAQPGISLLDEENRIVVKIEGSARVEAAVLLKESLAQSRIAHEVAIDWGGAEHVDACVLQILLALRQEVTERGLPFVVDVDNGNVRQYLKLSGLSEFFPVRSQQATIPPPKGNNA